MSSLWMASYIALWILMGVMMLGMVVLARQIGLLHRRLPPLGARMGTPGPDIGSRAPGFSATTLAGRSIEVGGTQERATLLVFMSTGCDACELVAPALRSVADAEKAWLTTALVAHEEEIQGFVAQHKLDRLNVVVSREVGIAYEVGTTPYGVLIDTDGVVRAKGLVNTLEQIESLFEALESGHPTAESRSAAAGGETTLEGVQGRVPEPVFVGNGNTPHHHHHSEH